MIKNFLGDLKDYGSVWSRLQQLKISVVEVLAEKRARLDEDGIQVLDKNKKPLYDTEDYLCGIQLKLDPEEVEFFYPEAVSRDSEGRAFIRFDVLSLVLLQSLKEVHSELSERISALEAK